MYDINAPHAFGLRESKLKAMHAYGRRSAPVGQGLLYDIDDLMPLWAERKALRNPNHPSLILRNYTLDRTSGPKSTTRSNSGARART